MNSPTSKEPLNRSEEEIQEIADRMAATMLENLSNAVPHPPPPRRRKVEITKEAALQLAQKEVDRRSLISLYSERKYEPAAFNREDRGAFVFFAACPELLAQDYAPGGFIIYVDKGDGHVWTGKDFEENAGKSN